MPIILILFRIIHRLVRDVFCSFVWPCPIYRKLPHINGLLVLSPFHLSFSIWIIVLAFRISYLPIFCRFATLNFGLNRFFAYFISVFQPVFIRNLQPLFCIKKVSANFLYDPCGYLKVFVPRRYDHWLWAVLHSKLFFGQEKCF